MKEHPVLRLLRPIADREVWRRAAFRLAATWALIAVAAAAILFIARQAGGPLLWIAIGLAPVGLVAGLFALVRGLTRPADLGDSQVVEQTLDIYLTELPGRLGRCYFPGAREVNFG